MHPALPHRTRLASIAAIAAAAAVLLSACSGADAQPGTVTPTAPASTTSSSAAASSTGSASGSSTAGSTSGSTSGSTPGSTSGSSSALITGTTSVSLSSRASQSAPSTPAPSGSAAVGSFDAGTVRYFAALCSGLPSRRGDEYGGLTGDLASKRTKTVALLTQQAERLDGAAEGMKAAGIPNIPDGDKVASVTIATYPKMADAARQGAKLVASATSDSDLDEKFAEARDTADAANRPLQDLSEIIGAPAVVGQMKKIAACASVLNG